MKLRNALIIGGLVGLIGVGYCYLRRHEQAPTPVTSTVTATSITETMTFEKPNLCPDRSASQHVYNSDRLQVIDRCVEVSGIVQEKRYDEDGDLHLLLDVDPQYKSMINKYNIEKQDGCLVLEAVCAHKVRQDDAKEACKNYHSLIELPRVGDRIRVTGAYVTELHHNNWHEIHPIYSLWNMTPHPHRKKH